MLYDDLRGAKQCVPMRKGETDDFDDEYDDQEIEGNYGTDGDNDDECDDESDGEVGGRDDCDSDYDSDDGDDDDDHVDDDASGHDADKAGGYSDGAVDVTRGRDDHQMPLGGADDDGDDAKRS